MDGHSARSQMLQRPFTGAPTHGMGRGEGSAANLWQGLPTSGKGCQPLARAANRWQGLPTAGKLHRCVGCSTQPWIFC
eukprot:363681-Chlamydomonas_euryale.AAC.6